MWFPKSPLHWALVVCIPILVLWYPLGLIGSFFATGIGLLVYWGIYTGLKNQSKPVDGGIAGRTNSTAVLAPDQAIVVAQKPKSDFAVPNYDVPHVAFTRTPDGFTVSFNKAKIGIHRGVANVSQMKHGTGLAAVGSGVGALVGLAVIGGVRLAQGGSNIEVNREAVIVDVKKMSRRDFGGFHISHSWKGAHLEGSLVVLGYTFGSQSYEFGGGWDERKGTEVAAGLNRHLRDTPMLGDETVASPEFLREARPSDF